MLCLYHSMFKNIIKEGIHEISDDVKIIRLTFLTSFFHSLIATLLIILNLNSLLAKNYENWLYIGKVAEFFVQEINKNHVIAIVITITIVLFLAYSIIYPIGQAAIIHYLKDRKSITHALQKGLQDFFPMFEFGMLSVVSSPIAFFLVLFRIFIAWWINTTSLVLMALWFIILISINLLKVYTRYCITLEGLPLYESLKQSYDMVLWNFWNSVRYMRMQTILLVNFSINLLLIAGVPFLLIYLALSLDIIDLPVIKGFIYIIFLILVLLWAYMSSFIRAFFAYYRRRVYKKVKG